METGIGLELQPREENEETRKDESSSFLERLKTQQDGRVKRHIFIILGITYSVVGELQLTSSLYNHKH